MGDGWLYLQELDVDGPWTILGHCLSTRPWDYRFRAFQGLVSVNLGIAFIYLLPLLQASLQDP